MKELDGLNVLLRAIGSSPVNSLMTPHPDAANGRATLDRNRRKVQKRGWWFNIDYGITYYPNNNGEIIIPEEISSIVFDDAYIVKRGRKLYDSLNNTYVFNREVCSARSVRILPWDELPESMQEHITYLSAAEFVRDEIEDKAKADSFNVDAGLALLEVKKEDLEAAQYNSGNNQRIARARAGTRPYGRGTNRFFGTPDH